MLYLFGKVIRMDMKTYLQQATPVERDALAVEVGSSVGYFYLLAGGHRRASPRLCRRLIAAEPKLTLTDLRPDIWSSTAPFAEGLARRSTDPAPP